MDYKDADWVNLTEDRATGEFLQKLKNILPVL
jgi:hypothetical protein